VTRYLSLDGERDVAAGGGAHEPSAHAATDRCDLSDDADPTALGFDRFVADHRVAMVRVATLLCGSPAQGEDLVQDVLVRLYPRWHTLADPLPYVRRCVTNEFLSWRRRWSTRHIRTVPDAVLAEQAVDPWADGPDPELWARVGQLPRQQRAAVVLRYYEGLDDAEIAAALGCREATVRAHVSRGLAALRRGMDAGSEDGDG
jgi:RNA polymerase sigma-70 factor (sigma-E family)